MDNSLSHPHTHTHTHLSDRSSPQMQRCSYLQVGEEDKSTRVPPLPVPLCFSDSNGAETLNPNWQTRGKSQPVTRLQIHSQCTVSTLPLSLSLSLRSCDHCVHLCLILPLFPLTCSQLPSLSSFFISLLTSLSLSPVSRPPTHPRASLQQQQRASLHFCDGVRSQTHRGVQESWRHQHVWLQSLYSEADVLWNETCDVCVNVKDWERERERDIEYVILCINTWLHLVNCSNPTLVLTSESLTQVCLTLNSCWQMGNRWSWEWHHMSKDKRTIIPVLLCFIWNVDPWQDIKTSSV